jgi:hypothetical protein
MPAGIVRSKAAARQAGSAASRAGGHEDVLEAVQKRATHFLMKTLPKVVTEMALYIFTYDACLEHRRCVRGTRSDQGINAGAPHAHVHPDVNETT